MARLFLLMEGKHKHTHAHTHTHTHTEVSLAVGHLVSGSAKDERLSGAALGAEVALIKGCGSWSHFPALATSGSQSSPMPLTI